MDWDIVSATGEWAGAIAVFVTLIYLSLQIRQNNRGIKSAARATWVSEVGLVSESATGSSELADVLIRGWEDPRDLDKQEWLQFMVHHHRLCNLVDTTARMFEDGVIDEELYELEMARALSVLALPGARQWWEAGGRSHVPKKLAEHLDDRLDEPSEWTTIWWSKERGFYDYLQVQ